MSAPGAGDIQVVDCQVHAWAPESESSWYIEYDDEQFARAVREHFSHDIYTWERVISEMDGAGVSAGILVNPTIYADDPSYALAAAEAQPGRFAIVHPILPSDPAVAERIAGLGRHHSVVGIRLSAYDDDALEALVGEFGATAFRAAGEHRLVVNLYAPGYAAALDDVLGRFPDTQFVIDHLGLRQPPMLAPLVADDPFHGLADTLRLARLPNVAVKASSLPSLSQTDFPYPDLHAPLERTIEAFGVERVLWGSDFTRVAALLSYREGLEYMLEWAGPSPAERAALIGGSARDIYGGPLA